MNPELRQIATPNGLTTWLRARVPTLIHISGLIAVELMIISALFFSIAGQDGYRAGMLWGIGGALALGLTLLLRGSRPILAHPEPAAQPATRTAALVTPLLIGTALMLVLMEINGQALRIPALAGVSHHIQAALLISALILITWGLAGEHINRARSTITLAERLARIDWREALALAVIVLVALAVRTHNLEGAARFFIDELHFSNATRFFDHSDHINLLMPFSSVAAFPFVYPYAQWLTIQFAGPTMISLRFVSAIVGVLTIPALYLLARELFDRRTALAAAALLATFPPHIQFSRIGLNNIADPLVGVLLLYFLARGLRADRDLRRNFALAGVMLGLTQYFYEGGRLLYPVLALVWTLLVALALYLGLTARMVIHRLRGQMDAFEAINRYIEAVDLRYIGQGLASLALGALLVGGPIYYTLAGQGRPFFERMNTAGVMDDATVEIDTASDALEHLNRRLYESALVHVSIPEDGLYYGGDTALVLAFALPFFLLGLYCAVWRLDHRGAVLLLLWVTLTCLGNALMQNSRISPRYVVAFPALVLAIALGARCAAHLILPRSRQGRHHLMAGIVIALSVLNVAYFFGPHLDFYNRQFRADLERDFHDVAFRARLFPTRTHIHIIHDPPPIHRDANDMLQYLEVNAALTTVETEHFTEGYLSSLLLNSAHAFFVAPDDGPTIDRLKAAFPSLVGPLYSDKDIPLDQQYALYYLPGR